MTERPAPPYSFGQAGGEGLRPLLAAAKEGAFAVLIADAGLVALFFDKLANFGAERGLFRGVSEVHGATSRL
jgi:hypothetical protein